MNKIIIIGHLGRDAEGATTKSGLAVSKFSVASSKKVKGIVHTEWFNCVVFGNRAVAIAEYLLKGTQVYIDGEFKSSKYTGRDGVEKMRYDVFVNDIHLIGGRKKEGAIKYENVPANPVNQLSEQINPFEQNQFVFEDSIPF